MDRRAVFLLRVIAAGLVRRRRRRRSGRLFSSKRTYKKQYAFLNVNRHEYIRESNNLLLEIIVFVVRQQYVIRQGYLVAGVQQ